MIRQINRTSVIEDMLREKTKNVISHGSLGTRQRVWLGTAIALLCSLLVITSFEGVQPACAQEATATGTGAPTDPTVPGTVPPTRPTVPETLTSTPETPTATYTPTVTPTSTPRPLYLPLLFRELRPVQDGGFESGQLAPNWQVEGNLGVHISAGLRHGGQYAADALLAWPRSRRRSISPSMADRRCTYGIECDPTTR